MNYRRRYTAKLESRPEAPNLPIESIEQRGSRTESLFTSSQQGRNHVFWTILRGSIVANN